MKPWSEFYDFTLPDLPGCPEAMLDHALREAAIVFCAQSLAWRWAHPDIAVLAGSDRYAYAPPADAGVHALTWAKFNEQEIDAAAGEGDIRIRDWRNQSGTPEYVLGEADGIQLVPKPDLPGTLRLEVALKPSPEAAGIDDAIFSEYREAIAHGAIGRLMLAPNKPYTNGQLAGLHQYEFRVRTGAAGTQRARNNTRAPLQTTIMRRH